MKVVLDTNVLVSGLLTPFGSSGEIVRMVFSNELTLFLDARILSEYRDVLHRPKFSFNQDDVAVLLYFIRHYGKFVPGSPLSDPLPDRDDEPFLEVALAGKVTAFITGNAIHSPNDLRKGVRLLSPAEFLRFYLKNQNDSFPILRCKQNHTSCQKMSKP